MTTLQFHDNALWEAKSLRSEIHLLLNILLQTTCTDNYKWRPEPTKKNGACSEKPYE